ncbi:hypothetical protein FHS52_000467 [Erythromicrobium ramosum]|jgi:hypothetical protein|uniref:Uncharacterized protein n=1 Tax=Erythrobacter ramosus TaxID=35811 RepID=A0A6I4UH42_9SPHN|nr:hypothetical protein [Erythrobacter ramosus]MBB3774524.1 hypothetical protein [Erythrobacter ramosus]MXP37826.1 hypothetical protein [Erythrobacter ramosus]
MMTLALAALLQSAAEPVKEPEVDNEILVIGRKLQDWRGTWRLNDGTVSCKTRRSTGDKAIDAIGCDAMVQCIAPIAPDFAAIEDAKLPKTEAQQRANLLLESAKIGDCIFAKREAGIAALAAERRSKRP